MLIDAWATWCKNCLTMDKTTLASDEVKQALSGYVKIKFKAEDPDAEPARAILQRLSAAGLPAYAILKPEVLTLLPWSRDPTPRPPRDFVARRSSHDDLFSERTQLRPTRTFSAPGKIVTSIRRSATPSSPST